MDMYGRRFAQGLSIAAALSFGGAPVAAQGTRGLPLEKAVAAPEFTERSGTTNRISADNAQKIVEACVAEAKAAKRSVTVFVLSPDGEIMHAHRMDGQNWVNTKTAYQKAKTALHLGDSTRAGSLRYNNAEEMIRRVGLDYLLVPGGLPIIVEHVLIGAIGVGGSAGGNFGALDEECARNALVTVLGPQPPIASGPPRQR